DRLRLAWADPVLLRAADVVVGGEGVVDLLKAVVVQGDQHRGRVAGAQVHIDARHAAVVLSGREHGARVRTDEAVRAVDREGVSALISRRVPGVGARSGGAYRERRVREGLVLVREDLEA